MHRACVVCLLHGLDHIPTTSCNCNLPLHLHFSPIASHSLYSIPFIPVRSVSCRQLVTNSIPYSSHSWHNDEMVLLCRACVAKSTTMRQGQTNANCKCMTLVWTFSMVSLRSLLKPWLDWSRQTSGMLCVKKLNEPRSVAKTLHPDNYLANQTNERLSNWKLTAGQASKNKPSWFYNTAGSAPDLLVSCRCRHKIEEKRDRIVSEMFL